MSSPLLGDPIAHSCFASLSPPFSQGHSLFSKVVTLLSLSPSLSFPTPLTSHPSLIYSVRSVRVSWLFLIIGGSGGPIPLFLSGCFIGSGSSGIGIGSHLLKAIWQRYSLRLYHAAETWYLEQSRSCLRRSWSGKAQIAPRGVSEPRLQAQCALGQASRHEAWAHGLAGLGPYPVQGVGARDCTIGLGSKAQRAQGSRTVQ